MTRAQRSKTLWLGAFGLAIALVAAGCGSGGTDSADTVTSATSADETAAPSDVDESAVASEEDEAADSEEAMTESEGTESGGAESDDGDEAIESDDAGSPAGEDGESEAGATDGAQSADGPTAEELRTIVLAGWDDIFASRFDDLIAFYSEDCQSRLTPEDFDLSLGEAMRSLEDLGVELDEIELEVRIDDFVAGESAAAVTIATLPGDEPSEDPPQEWVVENGEWRNPDCEDFAGVAATQVGDGDVGGTQNPAAIGSIFEFDEWRGGIVGATDAVAAGLALESADPPSDGTTWLLVTYEAQYFGTEIGEVDPFIVTAVGSSVYTTYEGDCALDTTIARAQGLSLSTEALPGQTFTVATCIDVPTDEIDGLIFLFEDVFSSFGPEIAFSASGESAPELPERERPAFDLREAALGFGEVHDFGNDWTVTVVAVVDGIAEDLISEWADPPPEGSTYPVAIYEATYSGPELTVSDSFSVNLVGDSIYDTYDSDCFVDDEALEAAYGTSSSFEFVSGETYRKATCATAPAGTAGELMVLVEHYELFEDDTVIFAP